jgi:hypothetical protein
MLYRLVQQHAATFFAEVEAAAGADLPQFVKPSSTPSLRAASSMRKAIRPVRVYESRAPNDGPQPDQINVKRCSPRR